MVAERRDLDVGGLGRVENRSALRDRDGPAVDLKSDHFSFHGKTFPFPLAVADRAELASRFAGAALDALRLVDDMRILDGSRDSARGALPRAHRAALALRRVDLVLDKLRALSGTALLVVDVLQVLVHEVAERRAALGAP